jgi:hypothetical protein
VLAIYTLLSNGVYGLAAAKALIDTIQATLDDPMTGLAQIAADSGTAAGMANTAAADTATLLTRLTAARASLLDFLSALNPANVRQEVTTGTHNLPVKVQTKVKQEGAVDFSSPIINSTNAYVDPSATRPREVYVKDGLS